MKIFWKILSLVVFFIVLYLFIESVRDDDTATAAMFGLCLLNYSVDGAKRSIISKMDENRKLYSEELRVFMTVMVENNAEVIKAFIGVEK